MVEFYDKINWFCGPQR